MAEAEQQVEQSTEPPKGLMATVEVENETNQDPESINENNISHTQNAETPKEIAERPEHIPEATWVRWKRKRSTTVAGYILVGAMVGLDYSFMFTTLYLYLKNMIKTQNPNLYYGLIVAAYSLSSTLTGACLLFIQA